MTPELTKKSAMSLFHTVKRVLRLLLLPLWKPVWRRLAFRIDNGIWVATEDLRQDLMGLTTRLEHIESVTIANADTATAAIEQSAPVDTVEDDLAQASSTLVEDEVVCANRGLETTDHSELNPIPTGSCLHSILLTADGQPVSDADIPFRMQSNLASFRHHHPHFDWRLWQTEALETFIQDEFGREVLQAFWTLIPLAYKADLGRYCLLYHFGGIYSDVSTYHFAPLLEEPATRLHVFRDGFSAVPWLVSNSLVGAPARLPVFEQVILRILENVRTEFYGHNPLCPTGPNLFGREIATHVNPGELSLGETVRLNRNPSTFSWGYLDISGELIAANVKRGSGLQSLGFGQPQDYNELYQDRLVYQKSREDCDDGDQDRLS